MIPDGRGVSVFRSSKRVPTSAIPCKASATSERRSKRSPSATSTAGSASAIAKASSVLFQNAFSGVAIAPAMTDAKNTTDHSGTLRVAMATRSPLRTPNSSTSATASRCAWSRCASCVRRSSPNTRGSRVGCSSQPRSTMSQMTRGASSHTRVGRPPISTVSISNKPPGPVRTESTSAIDGCIAAGPSRRSAGGFGEAEAPRHPVLDVGPLIRVERAHAEGLEHAESQLARPGVEHRGGEVEVTIKLEAFPVRLVTLDPVVDVCFLRFADSGPGLVVGLRSGGSLDEQRTKVLARGDGSCVTRQALYVIDSARRVDGFQVLGDLGLECFSEQLSLVLEMKVDGAHRHRALTSDVAHRRLRVSARREKFHSQVNECRPSCFG